MDMLPRTALPVLCFRNDRAISIVSIEHKMTTIHRTTTGSKYKMQCQTTTFRIQMYSKRILLNTPRIQDSTFKVQGKVLPGTLNLESWIRGVFNRIHFEYVLIRPIFVRGESFVLKDKEETYNLQARPPSH